MNKALIDKCYIFNFKGLFEQKGYSFFTKGIYNVNIIGVRSNNENKVTNKFDDVIILDYNTTKTHKRFIYAATTDPGKTYMLNPTNKKGTAILVPGQYKGVFAIDLHKGKYKALCQRFGDVKVYRDNNKNLIYDLKQSTVDKGMFGINIHRANKTNTALDINMYSAGCQCIADPVDFISFMNILKKSCDIYGNKFTYTLLDEKELDEYNEICKQNNSI